MAACDDEQTLMELLNSRPVEDGVERDRFAHDRQLRAWARERGGTGTRAEAEALRDVRELLTGVVRGERDPAVLAGALHGVSRMPELGADGMRWRLSAADPDLLLAARCVLAWAWLGEELPGRLRPCGNDECRLFLVDRSRAGAARWCSMKTCGNRMKARRNYARRRPASSASPAKEEKGGAAGGN